MKQTQNLVRDLLRALNICSPLLWINLMVCLNMCLRQFLYSRGFISVLVVILCAIESSKINLEGSILEVKFSVVNQSSISPLVPHRLMSPGWSQVSNAVTCAQRALSTFPSAKGFLHNSTSRTCTPLLWLRGAGAENATEVKSEEGKLFLVKNVCREDFQILEYGREGHVACLQDWSISSSYWEARGTCSVSQAHLVAVKSAEKLDLVRSVSGGEDRWVGLTDIQEKGTFVWDIDGANMTEEERSAVFPSNEPNDSNGKENCVQFRKNTQMLNDKPCNVKHGFICEILVPS